MKVWVLTGRTESGDDIGPYVWGKEPTQAEIDAVFMRDIPDEVEEDCCQNYYVSAAEIEY